MNRKRLVFRILVDLKTRSHIGTALVVTVHELELGLILL
jgi:hypothetical protein